MKSGLRMLGELIRRRVERASAPASEQSDSTREDS